MRNDQADHYFADLAEEYYPGSSRKMPSPRQRIRVKSVRAPQRETPPGLKPRRTYTGADGREICLYSIGQLARLLNRSAVTLRAWEAQGILPKSTFRLRVSEDERGHQRLYSKAQLDGIVRIADEEGVLQPYQSRVPMTQTRFTQRVTELFQHLNDTNGHH